MADKYFQLGINQQETYRLVFVDADKKPLEPLPGDKAVVRSLNPAAVIVIQDATPLPGFLATGKIIGGKFPANEVSIQGVVYRADGTQYNAAFIVDVGGGIPAAPPVEPKVPPSLLLTVGTPKPEPPEEEK
jgi:hypothetical protein